MITGIKLQLSSTELSELAMSRVEYHGKKAEFFQSKAKEIAPAIEEFDEEAQQGGKYMSGRNNDDPAQSLLSKAAHHRNRATYFKFLSQHVVPNETYILDENDLKRIEVLKGDSW